MDDRLPRYQRLRDEIADKIAQYVWRPGDVIPTEADLAATHGVAIGTVRKAVDALVADGLVERQQGRGTYVRRPKLDTSLFRFFRYNGESTATTPRSRLLTRSVVADPPEAVARALQLGPDAALFLGRLRLSDDKPFLREEIWLPYPRFAPLLEAPETEIGDLLYPAYDRLCGEVVSRAEEVITIGVAGAEDTELLALAPRTPIAIVERTAFGFDRKPLEWRRTHGPASTFRYKVDIR